MNNKGNSGVGFLGVLFIVLLVLKLTNVIDISWFWLTSVLWIPLCFGLVVLFCVVVFWMLNQ